ncbi:MAG TPA: hypothetical protein VFM93_00465 [Candidatus Limnocylindria bacterium]|nr:hypothetical protein [Candidatus Limnocylindria bacterium]
MTWLARNAAPLGIAAATYVLAVGFPGGDPDTWWHLASGRWMVEHRALLREDIFSFTIDGRPYSVGEWLGQVAIWLAYAAGGWQGIAVLRGLLVGLAGFFLARAARRLGAPWGATIPVVLLALALSKQSWTDRPQLFTLALFPFALDLMLAARAGDRRALFAFPVLILLWTNLHGGYALGLGLVLAFAVEAFAQRRPDARAFALCAALSVGASFLDPGALGIGGAASHVLSPPRFITEEMAPDLVTPAGFVFMAFLAATIAGALLLGGSLLEVLLLVPVLWLSLSAQRHLPYFAFVATPFLAVKVARLASRLPVRRGRQYPLPDAARAALALALVAGAVVVTPTAPAEPDERAYPVELLDRIRASDAALLHEYDWGGWLIWRAPERPVFVDGRLFPFMPAVLNDYVEAVSLGPAWKEVLDRHGIREVLLRPKRPLAVALRELGWVERARGRDAVILARP